MATKNNIDVGGEAPHHTELAARYQIEGAVYDLTQIIVAVKGGQSNDDWNARTMGDRLDAIKAYLKSVDAEKVEDAEQVTESSESNTDEQSATAGDEAGSAGGGIGTGDSGDSGDAAATPEPDEARRLLDAATAAEGPVETLRAFNQNDEADHVQSLMDTLNDVRTKLAAEVGEGVSSVLEALDNLIEQKRAQGDLVMVLLWERDGVTIGELGARIKQLEQRASRDKPLHGAIDELKPPY